MSAWKRAIPALVQLLEKRGYREASKHAASFAFRGFDAKQLLASERRTGIFPLSSGVGLLVRKRA